MANGRFAFFGLSMTFHPVIAPVLKEKYFQQLVFEMVREADYFIAQGNDRGKFRREGSHAR
jgi:hypothetical protein